MVPHDNDIKQNSNQTEQNNNATAGGYKVNDDDEKNLEEKDLKRSYLFGDSHDADPNRKGYESHGMGGQSFGENSTTRSGDDPANPSRNAGYSNDYFKRTEPSEEHPEYQNFKPENQQGEPDENQGKAPVPGYREAPDQQKVGGSGGGTHTVAGDNNQYQEGTADESGHQYNSTRVNSDEPGKEEYNPDDGNPD